jgi:hypothetical protein
MTVLCEQIFERPVATEGTVLEHQATFANALRSGLEIRKRIFDTIEEHHAHDFGHGREGMELYEELLSALRDSGMPEVVKEFETRFSPLLNPGSPRDIADLGPREEVSDQHGTAAVQNRKRRNWGGISVQYMAAFFLAFIIAFSAFRMTATERPTVTAVTIPAAKAAESVSKMTAQPTPVTSAEQRLSP